MTILTDGYVFGTNYIYIPQTNTNHMDVMDIRKNGGNSGYHEH